MARPERRIPDPILSRLSDFVAARMGLQFPEERWTDLERRLGGVMGEFGFEDPVSCLEWILSSPLDAGQMEVLASHLTVGETYFFREEKTMQTLETKVLPPLVRSRAKDERILRIWSAGCATGEEPYSIAILLDRLIPERRKWNITIISTDINRRALEKAREGVYSEWSFRACPSWLKTKYFRQCGPKAWKIDHSIREMVTFSYHNLMEDVYPPLLGNTAAVDLILCCNVLMYFVPRQAEKVVGRFRHCLVDGGWLIVSPTETSHMLSSRFELVTFPGVFFYRRQSVQASRTAEPHSPPPSTAPLFPPREIPEPVASVPAEPAADVSPKREEPQKPAARSRGYAEALTLYEAGRYEEAAEQITAVTGDEETDPRALALMARIRANRGRFAESLAWCERAIAADKLNARHHYLQATILQERGKLDQAVRALKRTLFLDHDFVLAHFALGNLARRQERQESSARHYRAALELLSEYEPDDLLPESEGMTAGRLADVIRASQTKDESR